MRKEKYCLIKQMDWNEYLNQHNNFGIIEGCNIYLNSLNDACSYIAQELLKCCSKYQNKFSRWEYENKLRENARYILLSGDYIKPKNLRAFQFIYVGYKDYYVDINGDIDDINILEEENLLLSNFISDIIQKIVDGAKVTYFYSFPIRKEIIIYKAMWNKRYPTPHHSKSVHYAFAHKKDLALSQDEEAKEYLDARDMFKGNYWRHKGIRHNKHSYIPGDWKHYHKCRKQWAKNIKNPSYEKLVKAVWKQDLVETVNDIDCI